MKRSIVCLAIVLLLFTTHTASGSVASFQNRLSHIIGQSENGKETFGIDIVSLSNGQQLFAHKQNIPLNPASCTKIITSAAALKLLGPEYRFKTVFVAGRRPVGGIANSLTVVGYGDPTIVIERLWKIARDLANTGLKKIVGDITIDDTYFEGYKYPGYIEGSGRAYNSLTGATALNHNTVTIVVSPSSRVGGRPLAVPDSAGPYFRITNMAKTGPRGSKNSISVVRRQKDGEDALIISGSIPVQSEPQYIYRNISDPSLYFGLALKALLEDNGVEVTGAVRSGRWIGGGFTLLETLSKPLSQIVFEMNKYSNNFIAEQLVKVLGAHVGGKPGTTRKGMKVIRSYLEHLGIPEKSYTLVNGSGLTRENRITASDMVKVLADIYTDIKIAPEFISSLSVAGVDGTMKSRPTSDKTKGLARAKTGSLRGVSTLVGIIPSSQGEMLGYAILMNGNGVDWRQSHDIQESLLSAMSAFQR